jgi:hypothetical protein
MVTDEDILAAATVLGPLIAKMTETAGMGDGIPFPRFASDVIDLALEISKQKKEKVSHKKR